MFTYNAAEAGYANLWRKAVVKASRKAETEKVARRIIAYRNRYEAVAEKIGHPDIWPLLGAIHDREASGSFRGVLHNGEHIIGTGRKTSLVPAGRGPFASWEDAAVDALTMPVKQWDRIGEWPIERWLYQAEAFNGWGYVNRGVNSPYVWAGTNLQQPGKYVRDHVWSATAQDQQLGIAAVLKTLFAIEPSLAPPSDVAPPPAAPPPRPLDSVTIEKIVSDRITQAVQLIVSDVLALQQGK